jgi:hypothetical protein
MTISFKSCQSLDAGAPYGGKGRRRNGPVESWRPGGIAQFKQAFLPIGQRRALANVDSTNPGSTTSRFTA